MSTDLRKREQGDPRSQSSTGADRLKTVVRRLPPNLPEDVFWQSVQAWVSDETVVWKSYHPGKLRTKRVGKEGTPSRAYIAFRTEALVTTFSRAYDGHVFRDKSGNESHAVVEYAPFQKVPGEKKKTDGRNKTIDRDEDYLSFLETLKATKSESVSLETLIAASQPGPQPTTTPLLEALKAEKSAQRDKEAILRNHAHYKDVVVPSKKEEKKKAVGAPGPPPPPSQLGKGESGKRKKALGKAMDQAVGKAGGPLASAKGLGPTPTAIPSAAASPAPAPASSGRRPPKDRSQAGKGETSALASGSGSAPGPLAGSSSVAPAPPTATTITGTPSSPSAQGRKNRPTIGLGRQFEAALSGAGVGVSQGGGGERKRRDKGGEGAEGGPGAAGKGKQKHREERARAPPAEVVPSILQRPMEPDVVVMHRPQLIEGVEGATPGLGPGPSAGGGPSGRGGQRRGRGARGRGHRGG